MLTIEEALALLGAVGSDNAPTAEQLAQCRVVLLDAARVAKDQRDKVALGTMLDAIKVTDLAIAEAQSAASQEEDEINSLVAGIPELAAETTPAEEVTQPEATPSVLSLDEAVQRLGIGRPVAQVVSEPEPTQSLLINGELANDATWSTMGNAFASNAKRSLRGGRTTIATFQTDYSHKLSGKTGENTRVLDELTRAAGDEAVIAAGGACSLAEPIRDQPMLASLARPIANSLPTVGTASGKVNFFGQVCLPQGGVGHWTTEDDEGVDGDDPSTWKDCTEIDCDDVQEVVVEAIYKCLTIGNFQHRFAPERWDAILHATSAAQARMAEQVLFAQIRDAEETTSHTVTDTGSVYVTIINALLRAAAITRQTQRYVGIRMKAIAPEWARDAARLDQAARALSRGRSADSEDIDVVLARHGIDITWSPDINPFVEDVEAPDGLMEFPDTFDAVLYPDGGAFRLDGGEINLGTEIRDHDLNRQNKVAAFSESFEAAVVRSCDTKHLVIPVSVCADAPC